MDARTEIDDPAFASAGRLRQLFERRELSPVDLVRSVIAHSERHGAVVNAFAETMFEDAVQQAREAERRYLEGTARPLEGIPVAVKAQQPMRGRVWSDGSVALRNRVADSDHPVVERIREAGGVIHARTTTPEFCCMPFTHSDLWGITRNPWNPRFSPGGSSGGSVAALAAGMTVLATGSDSGGSLRSPAAFTGAVGFKAPYGTIPTISPTNLDPFWQDGALARSVEDCKLLHRVLAGQHPRDPASINHVANDSSSPRPRVGLVVEYGNYRVAEEVAAAVARVGAQCSDEGFEVSPVSLPWDRDLVNRVADAHFGDHGAVDIARYAATAEITTYAHAFAERTTATAREMPAQDRNRIAGAMYRDVLSAFETCDLLIGPTVGITGLVAGDSYLRELPVVDGRPLDSLSDINLTRPFNILNRLPAISVPFGRSAATGLPIGIQVVGRPHESDTVLLFAAALQSMVEPLPFQATHSAIDQHQEV